MHPFKVSILTISITCSLLVILLAMTLYKVYRGTCYKLLLWLVSLLLVANFGYLLNEVAFYIITFVTT